MPERHMHSNMHAARLHLFVLFGGAALLTLGLCAVANSYRFGAFLFETLFLGGVISLLLASRRFRNCFARVHPAYACGLACLILASFWGQMLDRPSSTYPFVSWTMYTKPAPTPHFMEYTAVHESGRRTPLIPPFHPLRIRTFSGEISAALAAQEQTNSDHDPPPFDELVRALVDMRRDTRSNPITHVEAHEVTFSTDFRKEPPQIQSNLKRSVNIDNSGP